MKKMITAILVAFAMAASVQADALDAHMANDTVQRAQNPAKVVNPKSTPSVAPKTETADANAKDAVKIGSITNLVLVGGVEFCASENVAGLLEPALCDGSVKTIGDLRKAIAETKNALAGRGYYLVDIGPSKAKAYDDKTKTLELSVEPGRFGDIDITMNGNYGEGDWYSVSNVMKRFKYIKPGDPFNYRTFRQALRAVNAHPDMLADTKMHLSSGSDGSRRFRNLDAELTVEDSAPFHATIEVNNHAMEELDDWQMIVTLQDINLTGVEDVLSVSPGVTFDGQMWSIAGSYMRPFDWLRGGSVSVYGGYSEMDCDEIVSRMDLLGVGGFAGVNTSWNLHDDERRNVSFNLGVMWRNIRDQWTAQSVGLSQRDINLVPLTVGFSYGDKRRDWLGGLDFLSISETVNLYGNDNEFYRYSENADPNYVIFRIAWSRLQPLIGPSDDGEEWRCWSLFQKIEGQCAHGDVLISPERLAYGGHNCLRGYRNRGYLGDDGFYGTTEFRTPVWCNPLSRFLWPELQTAIERIQFAIFTDYGWLTYNETTTSAQQKDEFLWSAGFGIRAALTQYLSLNFDFAIPLRKCYADDLDEDFELYFSIKLQY